MANSPVLLGLECGGTRTVALAADGELRQLASVDAGPANLRLVTDEQLVAQLPSPSAVGVGMADSAELLAGTDPHDANSVRKGCTDLHPALVGGEFAGVVLEWQSVRGKRYVVQRAGENSEIRSTPLARPFPRFLPAPSFATKRHPVPDHSSIASSPMRRLKGP